MKARRNQSRIYTSPTHNTNHHDTLTDIQDSTDTITIAVETLDDNDYPISPTAIPIPPPRGQTPVMHMDLVDLNADSSDVYSAFDGPQHPAAILSPDVFEATQPPRVASNLVLSPSSSRRSRPPASPPLHSSPRQPSPPFPHIDPAPRVNLDTPRPEAEGFADVSDLQRTRPGYVKQVEAGGDEADIHPDPRKAVSNPQRQHRDQTRHQHRERPSQNPSPVRSAQPQAQVISWTGWHTIRQGFKSSKLLVIAYARPTSLSIWDCTRLDTLSEVVRVGVGGLIGADYAAAGQFDGWEVVHAGVVPHSPRAGKDPWAAERPLLGVLLRPGHDEKNLAGKLVLYSLTASRTVRVVDIPAPLKGKAAKVDSFEATSAGFVVVSTISASGPTLHVISTTNFELLHTISASQLTPYAPPLPSSTSLPLPAAVGNVKASATTMSSSVLGKLGLGGIPAFDGGNAFNDSARRRMSYGDIGSGGYGYGYAGGHRYEEEDRGREWVERGRERQGQQPHLHHLHQQRPQAHQLPPRAVYSLSHRLLAFASPASSPAISSIPIAPSSSSSPGTTSSVPVASHPSKGTNASSPASGLGLGTGPGGLPSSQAELGNAAIKVGGSVWGGVRTLGGMAVEAAKRRASGGYTPGAANMGAGAAGNEGMGSVVGKLFSRSAPEGGEWAEREREGSEGRSEDGGGADVVQQGGYFVTVLDLASLSSSSSSRGQPAVVAEFMVSKYKQISSLAFAADGCSLVAVQRDGHVGRVFRIRPTPIANLDTNGITSTSPATTQVNQERRRALVPPVHQYNLRRGRTSAVVEAVEWAVDGRWVAIGTRRGTVHVFGVNPVGGKVDARGLMEGKAKDIEDLRSASRPLEITPLVRLRVTTRNDPTQLQVPLSFTFLKPSESASLPAHLLPLPAHPHSHAYASSPPRSLTSAASASDTGSSPPISPHRPPVGPGGTAKSGLQDILLFDPVEGSLSLRRITMEMQPKEQGFGGASVSLPGVGVVGGAANWMAGGSPSSLGKAGFVGSAASSGGASAKTQGRNEVEMELVSKESIVMTWNLKRRWDGVEIRKGVARREEREVKIRVNWLAQAELSTFSKSKQILPRPVYLSHQFSFRTLGEDYHALIRRYQFDISGDKIDVRREVQISAYSTGGGGESFVEGFAAPRDTRHRSQLSSSFDEPLASALSAEFDHQHTSTVLPMLPNGSRPQSFRSSIPISIRTMTGIGDGMSDSLGRLRREINRVRSPLLKPHRDSSISPTVPLEFDEEDEDFLGPNQNLIHHTHELEPLDLVERSVSRDTSRGGSSVGPAASTPPTSGIDDDDAHPRPGDVETFDEWTSEDKLAVEEQERFDNIDVVGLLDEEQQQEREVKKVSAQKRAGRRRGRV